MKERQQTVSLQNKHQPLMLYDAAKATPENTPVFCYDKRSECERFNTPEYPLGTLVTIVTIE